MISLRKSLFKLFINKVRYEGFLSALKDFVELLTEYIRSIL